MTRPQDHGSRTLPGWAIDVLTDGADLSRGRAEVVRQVRRVMLSAHRLGIDWPTVHALLSDTTHRRLAHQLAHGHKGRRIAPGKREALLRDLWQDTGTVVASRPAWDREAAEHHLHAVRDALHDDDRLTGIDRAVMHAVLDLAEGYGTTRTVAPSRVIAEQVGVSHATVTRSLARLAAEGHWLSQVQKGDYRARRAALWSVGPGVPSELTAHLWGASPPEAHAPPRAHPPKAHPPKAHPPKAHDRMERDMPVTLSLSASGRDPDEVAAAIRSLLDERPDVAEALGDRPHLRLVRDRAP